MAVLMYLSIIAVSCLVIWRASDGFEVASEYLGRNLSDGVRGATINAIGSSIPELLTTLFFLFSLHDRDGFAGGIGTTAGSALFNGMIIPAIVILVVVGYGIVNSIQVSRKVILRDGLALILAELVFILIITGDTLYWWHGASLMGLYVVYVVYMLSSMRTVEPVEEDNKEENDDDSSPTPFLTSLLTLDLENLIIGKQKLHSWNAWTLLLAATAVMAFSCFFLVGACEGLGLFMGIPVYFVAVILASMATSVPDTLISMRDAQKGQYDDAVSNALGSNIFDICFALGFPMFLYTVMYEPIQMSAATIHNVTEAQMLLLFLTIIAFVIYLFGKSMGRIKAFLLLGLYLIFVIFILGRATENPLANSISNQILEIATYFDYLRFW